MPDDTRTIHLGTLATLALTSAHHVYGAIVYETPWRHHAVVVAVIAGAISWLTWRSRSPGARAVFFGTAALTCVAFGAFEGFYNHVLKNAAYLAELPWEWFDRLFPPPTYERPNDVVFELSGVLQVLPAAIVGAALVRTARSRGPSPARAT